MNEITKRPELPPPQNVNELILRMAADPNFDVDKLEKLLELQRQQEQLRAETVWTEHHNAALGEMAPIARDCENTQTRSRYASYYALDVALRPIYSKHGFSVSFNTEPWATADTILVVGYLSLGSFTRRYQVPVPVTTKGPQGKDVMTITHATISAVTYGKRTLLGMMFAISTSADDDGNKAARTVQAKAETSDDKQAPQMPDAPRDPETGELLPPHEIKYDGEAWQTWGAYFVAAVQASTNEQQIKAWEIRNQKNLDKMKETDKGIYARVESAVQRVRNSLKMKGGT